MSPKINICGTVSYSEDGGLTFLAVLGGGKGPLLSLDMGVPPSQNNWPGLGPRPKYPERPKPNPGPRRESDGERRARLSARKAAEEEWKQTEEEWRLSNAAYNKAMYSDPRYQEAAKNFMEVQRREPQELSDWGLSVYRDKVIIFNSDEHEALRDKANDALAIKHFVLRHERSYEKVKREVEALENMERLQGALREPIPEPVRLFIWQRDKGQCVKCGSRERLEFDHIIPVVAGGSNTERNVQLLCEPCNRAKGSTI
jgi:5-methylcytosine-specific restriction endonuclease McrA